MDRVFLTYGKRKDQAMAEGKVKWFNDKKGYGFIAADSGKELFVHHSSILGEGFKSLQEGERVSFEEERGAKGPQAVKVQKL
jgi:CspA family cold shock protein